MTIQAIRILKLTESEALKGGGGQVLQNPSETYGGLNWGQFQKHGSDGDVVALNPSMHYCRGMSNYGQFKKAGGTCG